MLIMFWANLLRYHNHLLKYIVLLSLKVTIYKVEKPSLKTNRSKIYTTLGIRGDLYVHSAPMDNKHISPAESSVRPSNWD